MAPARQQSPSSERSKYDKLSMTRKGCDIVKTATWMQLTQQHRAKDKEHMLFLKKMEKGDSISLSDIKRYRPLSPEDFSTIDSPWLDAPILVATNRERHNLLQTQCERYAKANGLHVYKWPVKHRKWEQKPADPAQVDEALQDPCFYQYAVPTALGYVTGKVNKRALVLNGTPFRYHSFIPNSQEQQDQIDAQVSRLPAGGIVSLSEPPLIIIIELIVPKRKISKWKKLTLVDGKVILPIKQNSGASEWHKTIVNGGEHYLPSKVLIKPTFPLEPAFVSTVHKSQGRTMRRVILALSERNASCCDMTYAHIYVALSRVRMADDIRLLLHEETSGVYNWSNLEYITSLKPDKAIKAFFAGFAERPDHWDPNAALAMYDEL